MLYKLICSVIIIASSGMIGLLMAMNLRKRERHLTCLGLTLGAIESCINHTRDTLPSAFSKAAALDSTGIFDGALSLLSQCSNIEQALLDSLREYRGPLNAIDKSILSDYAAGLGAGDIGGQIKNIKLAKQRLSNRLKEAEKDCQKRFKIFATGGFLSGLLVVIVLV